jgi:hypothetical protein
MALLRRVQNQRFILGLVQQWLAGKILLELPGNFLVAAESL